MGHFLVGLLLVIIIANSGWFLLFYNKASNKRAKIEDNLRQLEALINLKSDLLNTGLTRPKSIEVSQDPDSDIWQQAEELEEKLDLMQQLFDERVLSYNKYINAFPNAIASKIMNIKELPLWSYSLNNSEEAIKRCIL